MAMRQHDEGDISGGSTGPFQLPDHSGRIVAVSCVNKDSPLANHGVRLRKPREELFNPSNHSPSFAPNGNVGNARQAYE
jgi:hypothetical protein